nr:uncharacterized protein LOC109755261 [Aegilops tauschii subsp. strangulata]
MADHTVIHWLHATISPELLDAIMQPEDTALTVWTVVDGIFHDNHLARAVYVDAEYHALVQGDLTVMQYCTKLKSFTDQLCDLGQPVTETRQIFHLLRGLNRQFHAAIPHITSQKLSVQRVSLYGADDPEYEKKMEAAVKHALDRHPHRRPILHCVRITV